MDFPCEFVIKVMGSADAHLEVELLPIINKHVQNFNPQNLTVRASKEGKFKAHSIKLTAQSQDQLDALYREISARSDVLMVL